MQEATTVPTYAQFLRSLIALTGARLDMAEAAKRILSIACEAAGAEGGRILLFVEPRVSTSTGAGETWPVSDPQLAAALGNLLPGMPLEPTTFGRNGRRVLRAIVAPIADERVVGGLVLLFKSDVDLSGVKDVIDPAVDALSAIVSRARMETRDARLPVLEAALADLGSPVLVLDSNYNVIYLNRMAETAFGIALEQAEGQALDALPGCAPIASAIVNGQLPEEWFREGSEKVYAPRLTPLAINNGWLLTFDDITRYKKLDRNHAEFVHIATHDLRGPMTSAFGFASMLEAVLESEGDTSKLHMVRKILSGISQLVSLVENIQDAGRYDPETGFYEMERTPVNLHELIDGIVAQYLIPPDKHISLNVTIDDSVPIVNVDRLMIERAIINLIDNAVKYSGVDGEIGVSARLDGDRVVVSVRDTGIGIAPEDRDRLFKRHVRLRRPDQRKIRGTGLGLFIVRSVAQHHHGDAWVESEEGKGSTFSFSIPLTGENLVNSSS
ncbi:MAG: ATP-binding protein [Chloroflexota bacterium]|nr:MAG: hypothetical protein DIU68_01295 [Chloroflexota bacterium]